MNWASSSKWKRNTKDTRGFILMRKETNSSRSRSTSWSHGWYWEQVSGFLSGHSEGGKSLPGLVSPAAWFSLLEHPRISAKLFNASPLKKNCLSRSSTCFCSLSADRICNKWLTCSNYTLFLPILHWLFRCRRNSSLSNKRKDLKTQILDLCYFFSSPPPLRFSGTVYSHTILRRWNIYKQNLLSECL